MRRNIGTIDQVIRAMFGFALVAYVVKDGSLLPGGGLEVLVGAYLFVTGILKYCPLYDLLGLSTIGRLDRSA